MTGNNLSTASLLMAFPHLEIDRNCEQQVSFVNPVLDTRMSGSMETLEVLRFFETPRSIADAMNNGNIASQILEDLLRNMLVVNVDLLVDAVPVSIGKPVMLADFLRTAPIAETIAIIGAPMDIATTRDAGARHGPTEVRLAFPR